MTKQLLFAYILFFSQLLLSQTNKNELSYAEAFTSVRYFFPTNLSDGDWRLFNYAQIETQHFKDSNVLKSFSQIFNQISPLIEFSYEDNLINDPKPITNSVYWQHYGFGKKNDVNYKSCLVSLDSITYLYNGLQFFERVTGKYDSLEVQLKTRNNLDERFNFSNNFLIYGWKSGKQIIRKEKIQLKSQNTYYCRLNQNVEDVFLRYFLEGEYGINLNLEELTILAYSDGIQHVIFSQNFSYPIKEQLQIGSHHSVSIRSDSQGYLNLKSNEKASFHQIYKEKIEEKEDSFTVKLSNGIYMHFPLVLDKSQVVDSLLYEKPIFSKENYSVIAKSNLIDLYGHLLHFHPYFNVSEDNFKALFNKLYQDADTCSSLISVTNILRTLMFPIKDTHMYVYNGSLPTPKKFVGVRVEFVGNKCYVKNSNVEEIIPGDQIISFQGQKPWDIYKKNKNEFLGSKMYVELMAKKYVLIEDSNKLVEIVYRRNLKKMEYKGYSKYYSDFTKEKENQFRSLEDDFYYINLKNMEADTFQRFIQNTKINGLILDGREGIKVESKILSSLTQDSLFYPKVYVAKYKEPFKRNLEFDTLNKNEFIVGKSKSQIPIILLIESNNYSHEETFIHLANQIKKLELAGNSSAGCNGMVTEFRGIGGFEFRFTGSEVKKIDNTPLYDIGFIPKIKVKKKRRDYKKNKDAILIKSIKRLKKCKVHI